MKKFFVLFFMLAVFSGYSQSYYFGVKGGLSMGYQKWESFNQGLLFSYHAAGFWESYSDINPMNSLYAQFGFHNRGSALRNARVYTIDNQLITLSTKKFVFQILV